MNTQRIIAHIKIAGGSLLTAANAPRIVARALKPSDKSGNRLPSPIARYKDDPPYFQRWTIHRDEKGYCWKEVTHGAGICGYGRTVRELVIKTLCCGLFGPRDDIVVEVMPSPPPPEP
jgi:hypothetical protein